MAANELLSNCIKAKCTHYNIIRYKVYCDAMNYVICVVEANKIIWPLLAKIVISTSDQTINPDLLEVNGC